MVNKNIGLISGCLAGLALLVGNTGCASNKCDASAESVCTAKGVIEEYLSSKGINAKVYPGDMVVPIRHYDENDTTGQRTAGQYGPTAATGNIFIQYGAPGHEANQEVLDSWKTLGGDVYTITPGPKPYIESQLEQLPL